MIDNNAQTTTSTAPKRRERGRELLAEDLRLWQAKKLAR